MYDTVCFISTDTCTIHNMYMYVKLWTVNYLRLLILQPIFRFSIRGLPVSDEAEFDNLTAIFTELRLSVNIKVHNNYMYVHVVYVLLLYMYIDKGEGVFLIVDVASL